MEREVVIKNLDMEQFPWQIVKKKKKKAVEYEICLFY